MALNTFEQYLLELTNRARLDPEAEAARYNIDLNQGLAPGTIDGTSKQVLAPNSMLEAAAMSHSLWMLDTDSFQHIGANGTNGGDRMEDAGYVFSGNWSWGENLAWWGTTGTLDLTFAINEHHVGLFQSFSHRVNTLAESFREVGISQETGIFTDNGTDYNTSMTTLNFANSGNNVFLTGVSYNDINGNDFYDINEGRANITFSIVGGAATTTGAGGGYGLALAPGQGVFVDISHGMHTSQVYVDGATENVKLDLINDNRIITTGNISLSNGVITEVEVLGDGAVSVRGNSNNNILDGGRGNDTMEGVAGNNTINGFAGNDTLSGGTGNDNIYGGIGDDRLYGVSGTNLMYGGDGNDQAFGGDGIDTIYGGSGNDLLRGWSGDDVMYGGIGDDTMDGNVGNDTMYGGDGNDVMDGDVGNDAMYGGNGNDTMYSGLWSDTMWGGNGQDLMFGGHGNDRMHGDAGNDTMYGGDNNDQMFGGSGNDTMYGDDGDDRLLGHSGDDIIYGGNGNDRIDGSAGRDLLYGGNGNDTMYGDLWADTMYGDAGRDTLFGGHSNDRMWGGADNDILYGGDHYDRLHGDGGDDVLYGDAGGDQLFGGTGNDLLYGGSGNDRLEGGHGADTLYGGTGADRFVFRDGQAFDTVVDFNRSQGDMLSLDRAMFAAGTGLNDVVNTHATNDNGVLTIFAEDGQFITLMGNMDIDVTDIAWL